MSGGDNKKRKNKGYYIQNAKKQKQQTSFGISKQQLGANMNGFLITFNTKFTFCINEAKKILQQFLVKNDEAVAAATKEEEEKASNQDDFDKQLKEELDELKNEDNEYKIIDAGAKYTMFISIPNVNVNKTSEKIYEFIKDSKKPLCRYLQRFVPILNTCKAYNEDIERCVEQLFNKIYDCNQTIKYTCMFKSSNNSTLKRDDVIKIVNSYFQGKNSQNKVDFDQPDFVILIQVIRNICFVSYLKEYFVYRKYNLVEMGIKYSAEEVVVVTKKAEEPQEEQELNKE